MSCALQSLLVGVNSAMWIRSVRFAI